MPPNGLVPEASCALAIVPERIEPGFRRSPAPFVGKRPGAMALRRMPCGAHSTASDLVMMLMPAFDIADGTVKGPPFHTDVVRIDTTLAFCLPSSQRLPAARVTYNGPWKTRLGMAFEPFGAR